MRPDTADLLVLLADGDCPWGYFVGAGGGHVVEVGAFLDFAAGRGWDAGAVEDAMDDFVTRSGGVRVRGVNFAASVVNLGRRLLRQRLWSTDVWELPPELSGAGS